MGAVNIRMNESGQTEYLPIGALAVTGLNDACSVVNDWATKKGWNSPVDPPTHRTNLQIAKLSLAIKVICDQIENVRAGLPVSEAVEEFMYDNVPIRELEELNLLNKELRTAAQIGLMHTELAEATEAVITGKPCDDHCPQLPAVNAEMADLVIRVAHFCGERNIPLGETVAIKHEYNTSRPYKHGKKA